MVRRIAIIFPLFVFIYLVLIPIQSARAGQVDNDKKLGTQIILLKLEEIRNDAEVRIIKSEETIKRSQDLLRRAQAAGSAKAEGMAQQTLLKAQEAKEKNEWSKALAEELIDKMSKGKADDKSLCDDIEDQLHRDTEVIRRYQKTIEMSNKELQEWAEKNKKAEDKAAIDATMATVELISRNLLKNKKIADHISKRITEYQVKIKVEGVPEQKLLMERMSKKMVGAFSAYDEASSKVTLGNIYKAGLDLKTHYDAAKAMADSIQAANEAGNKEIKDIMQMLKDPENNLRESFTDLISLGAEEKLMNILENTPFLGDLASFTLSLRDYGYDALAWYESRERILQHLDITDQQLKAVAANEKQIKRTVERLKACRKVIEESGY